MEEVLSKFILNFKLENIERDSEISKSLIMSLIEEKINISSSPFLCSILEYFLKNSINNKKYNIIFIGERENLTFYSTIGRKMGINLLKKENGFYFVDINDAYSKLLSTQLPLEENYPESFNIVRKAGEEYIECDHKLIDYKDINKFYNNVFDKIKKLIDGIKSKENNEKNDYVVIFDMVNDESLKSIDEFLKYCFFNGINLIFSINKELNNENIIKYIEYLSDIEIILKNNESGFSKDLTGIIDILIKMDQREEKKSFRYNLKTNEIKIFTHIEI